MAVDKKIQGKTLQKTIEGLKSNEKSILRASHLVHSGNPSVKKNNVEREETKSSNTTLDNMKESKGRARKKRSLTWRGYITRGLKIRKKLKAKN